MVKLLHMSKRCYGLEACFQAVRAKLSRQASTSRCFENVLFFFLYRTQNKMANLQDTRYIEDALRSKILQF